MNSLQEVKKLSQEIEEKYRTMFDILMKEYPDGNPMVACDEIYVELPIRDIDHLNYLYNKYHVEQYKRALVYVEAITSNYESEGGKRVSGHFYFSFWLTDTKQSFEVRI